MGGEDKLNVSVAAERVRQLMWHFQSKLEGIEDAVIENPQLPAQRDPVSA